MLPYQKKPLPNFSGKKRVSTPDYIQGFQAYLEEEDRQTPQSTVRNYVKELRYVHQWAVRQTSIRSRFNSSWDTVISGNILYHFSQKDIELYFKYMFKVKHSSVSTRNVAKYAITRFYNYGRGVNKTAFVPAWPEVPIEMSRKEKFGPIKVRLSLEDIQTLRHLVAQEQPTLANQKITVMRNVALLEILITTGMRPGEIGRIEWSNLDFKKSVIHVLNRKNIKHKTKDERWRKVPFLTRTQDAVLQYAEEYRYTKRVPALRHLFPPLSSRNANQHIADGVIWRITKHWTKTVPHCNPHNFRHHFATLYLKTHPGEASAKHLALLLGDTVATVLTTYYHPDPDEIIEDFESTLGNIFQGIDE